MATPQEKAQCVTWLIETRSDKQVQRNFRPIYGRNLPLWTHIREWYKKFKENGSCQKQKSTGRPSTSEADVERVRESFRQSVRKSIWHAPRELGLPTTTVHRILQKRLKLYAYKVQIPQELKQNDGPKRKVFTLEILSHRGWRRLPEIGHVHIESLLSCIGEGQSAQCEDLGLWKPPLGHWTRTR